MSKWTDFKCNLAHRVIALLNSTWAAMPPNKEQDAVLEPAESGSPRKPPTIWDVYASGLLSAEMKKRGLTYEELVLELEDRGMVRTPGSLMNRVSRGTFSLAFFLQVARSLGIDSIDISHIPQPPSRRRFKAIGTGTKTAKLR